MSLKISRRFYCCTIACLVAGLLETEARDRRPNILFIMADDYGWNDVSWHNKNMPTPVLQQLATEGGVILNQSYVNQVCSPTRSAFITGHYPFHLGTQSTIFQPSQPGGVPVRFAFLPENLRRLGYKTYLVGKWHLGYCNKSYIPYGRGFDYFYGYYGGSEDYFTHIYDNSYKKTARKFKGLDLWNGLKAVYNKRGVYSTGLFANKTIEVIAKHNSSQPFFLYLAFQAVHAPLEVPAEYLVGPCQNIKDHQRKTYCGMVKAMDIAVGRIIQTLKDTGFYNNTVVIFSTDNGGQTLFGGNNWPLRGNKNTLWEGGNRAISFVHAPYFLRETGVRNQLFSIVDWFPTILTAVGKATPKYGDGISQWDMIIRNSVGKRSGLVYNIYGTAAAIRMGRYKLITGNPGSINGWIPPPESHGKRYNVSNRRLRGPWLFDIKKDPTERVNLALKRPRKTKWMKFLIAELRKHLAPSVKKPLDPRGDPTRFNGTFATGWC